MLQVYDDLMFKPAWPVLFAIAAHMSDGDMFAIGPGVVNPFHSHPSLIATNLACLDEETRGKSFLMIGRGAFHDLFYLEPPPRPLAAISEAIEIIHNIVSGRKVEDFRGSVFGAKSEAQLRWRRRSGGDGGESKNSGNRTPPIWIGTWGKKTCELAGRMKQVSGVMVSSITDPKYIRFLKEKISDGATSVGRSPTELEVGCVPGTIVVSSAKERDRALSLAREASAIYLPYLSPMTEFLGIGTEEILAVREALARGDLKLASSLVSDKSVDAFKLWGTPDDVIEKVSKLVDGGRGVNRINFGFGRGAQDLEGIDLLGSKVLPYFYEHEKK